MKTLLLATLAVLTLGAGSAFAEGGDGWDMVHMLDQGPVGFTKTQPPVAIRLPTDGLFIGHSQTDTRNAAGAVSAPRMVTPPPAAPRFGSPLSNYPLALGGG